MKLGTSHSCTTLKHELLLGDLVLFPHKMMFVQDDMHHICFSLWKENQVTDLLMEPKPAFF